MSVDDSDHMADQRQVGAAGHAWFRRKMHPRAPFLAAVIGLHVLFVSLLLLHRNRPDVDAGLQTVAISAVEQQRSGEVAPPAIPVTLSRPSDLVLPSPPTDISIDVSSDVPAASTSALTTSNTSSGAKGLVMITDADYVHKPLMYYPPESRRRNEEGEVLLLVLIGPDGMAKEASIYRSSGSPFLDEAARQAVYTAVFRPFSVNGVALAVRVIAPFRYNLIRSSTDRSF
jgi:protein TonB